MTERMKFGGMEVSALSLSWQRANVVTSPSGVCVNLSSYNSELLRENYFGWSTSYFVSVRRKSTM